MAPGVAGPPCLRPARVHDRGMSATMTADASDPLHEAEGGARPRIVIVDDDPGIREAMGEFLGANGYAVDEAQDLDGLAAALARAPADLVVLDVMLPGEDGLSICRRLAAQPDAPAIVMLSAMGEDTDRIVGLELGADDYLAKPCNPRELLARVRAVLRRRRDGGEAGLGAQCEFGGWRLDLVRRELRAPDGLAVNLSGGEFSLLRAFVEHPQRVLTRDQLLDYARGPDSDAYDRAIDVQISRLRKKLDDGAHNATPAGGVSAVSGGDLIRTVRNEGYMLMARVTRR
jgi:two-component system, OmpR family, response regulator